VKILLIDVPFELQEAAGQDGGSAAILNVIPALGLAYLAAVSEREGHDVRILDCARGLAWDSITREASAFRPEVVGLTATTLTFKNAVKAANLLRETLPQATLVVGGPHPTAVPEQVAATRAFDFLVVGEGEATFIELLKHLEGRGETRPDAISGLAFWRDGQVVITAPRERIDDLDTIPFPARHLLPSLSEYHPTPASCRRLPLAHIMTSRGCPTRCNFCDRSIFGTKYRARSAGNVLAKVEEVVSRHGAGEVRFFDDTFTLNRKRLEAICQGLRKFRPRLPWTCLTKVTAVDLDMLRMMRDAGCWQVLFGLESGDDRVLESLGKETTVQKNRQAVAWARQAGLRVRADFIVGTPHETMESLENTLKLAKELSLDYAHFNKFIPFPGTEFYRQLTQQGYRFDFDCTLDFELDHDVLVYVPQGIDPDDYRRFLDRAYREFYLRPRYLLRRLLAIRTFTELRGQVKGFFALKSA
jgi:anaerobic magnesium-protoporphyrin IX monomethyl ester cyclase